MADDCLALMRRLGHDQFTVAGHDRGSYVAFRLAMNHPEAVSHLAVLDSVPIGQALVRYDATFATRWWHWFFLGNPDAPAERVINAEADAWYHGDGERAQMGELAGRITNAPSMIRPQSPPCARTTVPGSALTAITTTPTWPGACCPAQSAAGSG